VASFSERPKKIVGEGSRRAILFIDELHTPAGAQALRRSFRRRGQHNTEASLLSRCEADDRKSMPDEYRKYIERDAVLSDGSAPIQVPEAE